MSLDTAKLLSVARGDTPADLVLRGGRIVNVFSGEIEPADIAIVGDRIAGVGEGYLGKETIDLNGAYIAPGLIDAHVHIESSLCIPAHFAAAVVPRGVTTVVADPHEIANVAGVAGIRFMVNSSGGLPLKIVWMAPSCVPATDMATAGASLDANDLAGLLADGTVHGLAEVMNFPGVVNANDSMLSKLRALAGRPRDGHAPGLLGRALCAYVGSGIGSDHECVSVEEARQKLARGLYIFIREATNARNLDALLPLITPQNARRICLCTDDRTPHDLLEQGSVDEMLRRVIAVGIDPVTAFRLCTLNPAEWFALHDRGAIAPGRTADLMIFDDLRVPRARQVFAGGQDVTNWSPPPDKASIAQVLDWVPRGGTVDLNFAIPARGSRVRVIGALSDQLTTEHRLLDATIRDGQAIADVSRDVLKIAVIERHGRGGRIGLGFIQGFGLKRGAIAGTVAHDHHNLVVIGCDDQSMRMAAQHVNNLSGGLVAEDGPAALACLWLPVAGLMSDKPIAEVRDAYARLLSAARDQLGSPLRDPFMAMSFMALEVIPSLKLTDQGLIDVEAFEKVDLFV